MNQAIIDTNVNLSRWPFRRLPGDETAQLVTKLRSQNVVQAWAGSFDGILHQDISGVNSRLARECQEHGKGFLVPMGTINPTLPDWEEDLRRCDENHQMPGIRLYPNYHGYQLDDPRFARLLSLAAKRHLIVQLAVKMEDPRTQHWLLQVSDVETAPLADLLGQIPSTRLVMLNALKSLSVAEVEKLSSAGQVYFDIAMLEGVGGVEKLLSTVPLDRVLFGSHFPFFYLESARMKLKESALSGFPLKAIAEGNARQLLKS